MKVIVDGKEIELKEDLEKGELELDKNTPINNNDLENTKDLSEEVLEIIQEMDKDYE